MQNTHKRTAVIMMGLYFTVTVASPVKPTDSCDRALEDQNLPHQSDCSKYYRCVYGKKVPKECPEKMLFNPSIGNCDLYYNVECPHDDDEAREKENSQEAIENLTGRNFVRNPKVYVTSESTDDGGETSTKKFVYVPHDSDPAAYYKFENGERLLLYCDEGMVFSFELEICAKSWIFK